MPDVRPPCPRLDALPGRELEGGLRVAEAHNRAARMQGLMKLEDLPAQHALHIPKCWSIHTFRMEIPIDLIWLAKDGKPVRVDREVPPRRMKTCLRARSVVECRAGHADDFVSAGL